MFELVYLKIVVIYIYIFGDYSKVIYTLHLTNLFDHFHATLRNQTHDLAVC